MKLQDQSLFKEQAYINGEWVSSDDGSTFEIVNPATGDVIGTAPDMGADETRRAIEAANAAWPAWQAKTAKERAILLRAVFDEMMKHQEDLAHIITLECGKPLAESMGEVAYGAAFIE